MDSSSTEIVNDFKPFFRVYKDGRVERYQEADFVPPSQDPETGVISKDVIISPENNVSARLYRPKTADNNRKLPLLIYVHGGGFSIGSAFSSLHHKYVNHLVAEANVIAVSIEYRLAPEHPIPACYEDSWAVLKWVALHAKINSAQESEPWLRDHVDFTRIYLAGDSAGANIAHDMMVRATTVDGALGNGIKLMGMALIHPFFGDDHPIPGWIYMCAEISGVDDPRLNPAVHPHLLSKLVCTKVLICTAGNDHLRPIGWTYYEALKSSGWPGELDMVETKGESHVFHLLNPTGENAAILLKQVASFIK